MTIGNPYRHKGGKTKSRTPARLSSTFTVELKNADRIEPAVVINTPSCSLSGKAATAECIIKTSLRWIVPAKYPINVAPGRSSSAVIVRSVAPTRQLNSKTTVASDQT